MFMGSFNNPTGVIIS